jgi:hypothetical protein
MRSNRESDRRPIGLRLFFGLIIATGAAVAVVMVLSKPGSSSVARKGAVAVTTTQAQVDALAKNEAGQMGDTAPTSVTWVASTRDAAVAKTMGAGVGGDSTPVYVLELPGSFVDTQAHVFNNSGPKPHGSVLQIVVKQSDFQITDVGLQNDFVPLDSLGTPETDSLNATPSP